MRRTMAELIDKARQVVVPDTHPRTAAALTELMHAVNVECKHKFKHHRSTRIKWHI